MQLAGRLAGGAAVVFRHREFAVISLPISAALLSSAHVQFCPPHNQSMVLVVLLATGPSVEA